MNSNLKKAVILLSSGLDSTVNMFRAVRDYKMLFALTFDYGQRAASREIQKSKELCALLQIPHQVVDLKFFKEFTKSALVNRNQVLPVGDSVDVNSLERSMETAKSVWVPNRNGIFLNIAAGFAEGLKAENIIVGFNKEEAATFPDNSFDFQRALDHCFAFSTANHVTIKCYTTDLDKTEIAQLGKGLSVPFNKLWPCYEGQELPCGQCESCLRFKRATQDII